MPRATNPLQGSRRHHPRERVELAPETRYDRIVEIVDANTGTGRAGDGPNDQPPTMRQCHAVATAARIGIDPDATRRTLRIAVDRGDLLVVDDAGERRFAATTEPCVRAVIGDLNQWYDPPTDAIERLVEAYL